ncbi:MAG TPA: nuclear transport factor 2 family protein [Ktedonobacterales bacterium]|nr:nuclear transport factor 2 family protein [Ktedonobacterales bacterium]
MTNEDGTSAGAPPPRGQEGESGARLGEAGLAATPGQAAVPASGMDVLRAFGECLVRGDADGAAMLFAPDAVYEEPPVHFSGRDAIHAFIAEFAATHSDARFEVLRALASPDGALLAAEWRWSYTRSADSTRRAFTGISFVELRDGLIARWRGFSAPMAG